MTRNIPLMIVSGIVAIVAIGLFLGRSDPNRPVLVSSSWAPGQFLAVTDIEWSTLWGQHALTANFSTTREAVRFSFAETAIVGICNEILDRMPRAPAGVVKADVYRVNFRRVGGRAVNFPMPVENGRCLDWTAGTVLFPNYPPPLQNWQLSSYGVFNEGKNAGTTFLFTAKPGSGAIIEEGTFADACRAMLTEQILASRNITDFIQGKVARIKLAKFVGPEALNFGMWQTREFKVLSGECVSIDGDGDI